MGIEFCVEIYLRMVVTAPHGRPNLRSRLHSCHAQDGGPQSPQRTCGGIGEKKKKIPTLVDLWNSKSMMLCGTACKTGDFTQLQPRSVPYFNAVSLSTLKQGNIARAVNVNTASLQ